MLNRKNVMWLLVLALLAMPMASAMAQSAPSIAPAPPEKGESTAAPAAPVDANGKAVATSQPADGGGLFGGGNSMMLLMLGAIVVLFVLSSRSRKKQENKRKEMINTMKKGDRVTTIGGVIGTIIEVKENEVIVKVDEQNNVRMHFVPSAIHTVGEAAKEEKK